MTSHRRNSRLSHYLPLSISHSLSFSACLSFTVYNTFDSVLVNLNGPLLLPTSNFIRICIRIRFEYFSIEYTKLIQPLSKFHFQGRLALDAAERICYFSLVLSIAISQFIIG